MTEKTAEIIVYGTAWCPDCHFVRTFLESKQVPFHFINIDTDLEGRAFVLASNHGYASVPTLLFPDGSILTEPGIKTLQDKLNQFSAI